MDDLVRVVTAPDGRSFALFLAPPGSALDTDELGRGTGLGWLVTFVSQAILGSRRALGGRWRVVVHERRDHSLGPILARSSHASEREARARVDHLDREIAAGAATF